MWVEDSGLAYVSDKFRPKTTRGCVSRVDRGLTLDRPRV